MVTILNTSIITSHGAFKHEPLTLSEAMALLKDGFTSAVWHSSTCEVLSTLLNVKVELNRINYVQTVGSVALGKLTKIN